MAAVLLALAACGGSGGGLITPATYTIGGTVAGLAANESVTLSNNGAGSLTVSSSGTFTFPQPISPGGSYAVTVTTQPAGQSCVVSNGSGSGVKANVTTVQVACSGLQQFAYVVNNVDRTVSQYSVTASGTLVALSPATIATGNSPRSITVDPGHHYAFVTNLNDNTVSQYIIQKSGMLAANSPATVATGRGPWALQFDAAGKFAYVVNSLDQTLSQYSLGSTGALEALAVTPVATGLGPWNFTLTPNGKYAYVSNVGTYGPTSGLPVVGNTVSQYSIAPDTGQLAALNPSTAQTGGNPAGAAVDATSTYAYVTSIKDGVVWQYSIGAAGELTPLTPNTVTAGAEPDYIAIHPNNKYAYVANYGPMTVTPAPGSISQYNIGTTGLLTPMTTPSVPAGLGSGWLSLDSFGQFLYVVNTLDNTVSEFSIGTAGSLTALGTVPAGNSPFEIAITIVGP